MVHELYYVLKGQQVLHQSCLPHLSRHEMIDLLDRSVMKPFLSGFLYYTNLLLPLALIIMSQDKEDQPHTPLARFHFRVKIFLLILFVRTFHVHAHTLSVLYC